MSEKLIQKIKNFGKTSLMGLALLGGFCTAGGGCGYICGLMQRYGTAYDYSKEPKSIERTYIERGALVGAGIFTLLCIWAATATSPASGGSNNTDEEDRRDEDDGRTPPSYHYF